MQFLRVLWAMHIIFYWQKLVDGAHRETSVYRADVVVVTQSSRVIILDREKLYDHELLRHSCLPLSVLCTTVIGTVWMVYKSICIQSAQSTSFRLKSMLQAPGLWSRTVWQVDLTDACMHGHKAEWNSNDGIFSPAGTSARPTLQTGSACALCAWWMPCLAVHDQELFQCRVGDWWWRLKDYIYLMCN